MADKTIGALIGWKREQTRHGIALTVQLHQSKATGPAACKVTLVMNDRQLRSLARDLVRAAGVRGMTLRPKKPWWAFWRSSDDVG